MATSNSQRIGIWIIAGVLLVGTFAGFIAMILQNDNAATEQQLSQEKMDKYNKIIAEYQEKVNKQGDELSGKYYSEFSQYANQPVEFDAGSVTDVATNDLKVGDGEEITKDSKYSAYYIGWLPTGKVFDQSIDNGKLKPPIAGGNLIEGWNEGVIGMKVGGVREITIPSQKAYGEAGSKGADGNYSIPPNTPLKFVVFIIPQPAEIPQPDLSTLE